MNLISKTQKIQRLLYELSLVNSVSLGNIIKLMLSSFKDLRDSSGFSRSLINVTLELTHRCNINCDFCFLKQIQQVGSNEEMTTKQIKDFIDSITQYKVGFYLTGGEPLIREDCLDLVSHIKSKKVKCGINTNGISLDACKIKRLIDCRLDYILISLHGSEEVHERLCGTKGIYAFLCSNISGLVKSKGSTKIILTTVICPDNINDLPAVYHLSEVLNVDGVIFQHMRLKPDNLTHCDAYNNGQKYLLQDMNDKRLSSLGEILFRLKQYSANRRTKISIRPDLSIEDMRRWYRGQCFRQGRCFYSWTDMRILPNGDIVACERLQTKIGNIVNEPWYNIWNNDKFRKFRLSLMGRSRTYPECVTCPKSYRFL